MNRRQKVRKRGGAAAVELAIVLPLLCLLFVIAVDFGRAFYFSIIVANCARNGALYGSQDPTSAVDTSGIKSAAEKDAGNLNLQNLTISSSTNSATNPTSVTVSASYPFTTLTNYPVVGGTRTISRTVTMSVAPWTPN